MLPIFKSILCLNGRLPDKTWFAQQKGLVIVAADGAANTLFANGIQPDFIIGDLDSLEQKHFSAKCNILRIAEQDTTDFEKCLIAMEHRFLYPSLIIGIAGGEVDHSIYNLNCFMQHARTKQLFFFDIDENHKCKLGFPVFTQQKLQGQINKTISLMPFPEAVVSTSGLKWNLTQMQLSVSGRASMRNVVIDDDMTITIQNGAVLVVLEVEEDFLLSNCVS